MVLSGIVLAFLSFYKNNGDISEGVLWYVAQALTYAGGIFGVSIYFKTKLGDFESRTKKEITECIIEANRNRQRQDEFVSTSPSSTAQRSADNPREFDPIDNSVI